MANVNFSMEVDLRLSSQHEDHSEVQSQYAINTIRPLPVKSIHLASSDSDQ